jgi:hypothetical protein
MLRYYDPKVVDLMALSGVVHEFAKAVETDSSKVIYPGYGNNIKSLQQGVSNFTQGIIPLSGDDSSYQQTLCMMTGNAGQQFIYDVTSLMSKLGVSSSISNQIRSTATTLGYSAMGIRLDVTNPTSGMGIYAVFQGPMNLSTTQMIFTQMSQANSLIDATSINSLLSQIMTIQGLSHTATTIIDVSNASSPVCEVIFQLLPGDSTTVSSIVNMLGIAWAELNNLTEPMQQTNKPYLVSVIMQSNSGASLSSTINVYLPYNMLVSTSLLQNAGTDVQTRMDKVAEINDFASLHLPWFVAGRTFSNNTVYSVVSNLN